MLTFGCTPQEAKLLRLQEMSAKVELKKAEIQAVFQRWLEDAYGDQITGRTEKPE